MSRGTRETISRITRTGAFFLMALAMLDLLGTYWWAWLLATFVGYGCDQGVKEILEPWVAAGGFSTRELHEQLQRITDEGQR